MIPLHSCPSSIISSLFQTIVLFWPFAAWRSKLCRIYCRCSVESSLRSFGLERSRKIAFRSLRS
ncbi:unnamed protein product [Musa acuminata subsp. malaccensis]|uniref:(wild Malaysian banana) hypothetical protein n=1 Tax=Musa acuminata subsp. malaccensis TaxID=214687 RepID=A0A804K5U7_MUSAM|nr:unnamed protein product [Musa acuminata subsp. malaccensis]